MAIRDVVGEAILNLKLEDNASKEMAAAVAEFRAEAKALGREKAEIKIKADTEQVKRELAEAKKSLKELTAEEKRLDKLRETLSGKDKGRATRERNAKRRALDATRANIKATEDEVKALERKAAAARDVNRMATQLDREESGREKKRLAARKAQEKAEDDLAKGVKAREKAELDAWKSSMAADSWARRANRDRIKEAEARGKAEADAEEHARTATLRHRQEIESAAKAYEQYAKASERMQHIERAGRRAQGSDKIRFQVDAATALRQMEEARLKLEALGLKPIAIKAKLDISERGAFARGANRLGSAFGFTRTDQIKGAAADISRLASAAKKARINIGPLSTSIGGLVVGLFALAPIITGIIGALGSLVSVIGSGLVGAVGVGTAALSGFGFAFAGMFTTILPFVRAITNAQKYLKAYNLVVAKYGENSKQGQKAQKILNHEMAGLPPQATRVIDSYNQIKKKWQELTQTTANRSLGNIVGATLKTINADMNVFAKGTNLALVNVSKGWDNFMADLRTPEAQHAFGTIFENFDRSIPNITDGLDHLAHAFGIITAQFSKHLPSLTKGFDAWAAAIDNTATKSDGFSHGVNQSVRSLQSLGHFTQAAGRFLITFFKAGVEPGTGFVNDMTKALDNLTERMNTVSGQRRLNDFFTRSIQMTKEFWNALMPLLGAFVQFSQAAGPFTVIALRLVTVFTKLVAALAGWKPLQWAGGILLATAIVGRLTAAIREGVQLLGVFGKRFATFASGIGTMGIKGSFKNAFGSGTAISDQMIAAGRTVGAEIAGSMVEAGNIVAERLGVAEAAGGAAGGAVRAGEGAVAGASGAALAEAGAAEGAVAAGGIASGLAAALPVIGIGALLAAPFVPALVHTISHWLGGGGGKSEGQRFAENFTAPLGPEVDKHVRDSLTNAIRKARDTQTEVQHRPTDSRGTPTGVYGQALSPTELKAAGAKSFNAAFNVGYTIGNATVKGLQSVKFPTQNILIRDFMRQLSKLHGEAKIEAAKVMLNFSSGLVQQGKLPRKQFDAMIATLEQAVPGLQSYLLRTGRSTARSFAIALRFDAASATLKSTLAKYRQEFGDWSIDTKITGDNIDKNIGRAMRNLRETVSVTTGRTHKEAVAELHRMSGDVDKVFSAMVRKVGSNMGDMKDSVARGSQQAYKIGARNWNSFAGAIRNAVASGALSVKQGNDYIIQAVNAALKGLGEKQLSAVTISRLNPGQLGSLASGQSTSGAAQSDATLTGHFARGGLMQVGHRGQRGRDEVPMSINGKDLVVGKGEQVAILNSHQQRVANNRFADMGGFHGLFNNVTRPHYMASGGIVQAGNIGAMIAEANRVDRQHFPYVWGGGHGGWTGGPFDCSGAVSDVLHAGGVLSAPRVSGDFMNYGLPGPGAVTLYANPTHVYMSIDGQYFGTSNSNPGGGAGWFPGGPRPGFAVRHVPTTAGTIKAPKIGGRGAFAKLARGAMKIATRGANARLKRAYASAFGGQYGGGDSGEFGPVVTASEYSGGTTADGRHNASRDIGFAELSTNYGAPVSQLDFAALGHLPFGTTITVGYNGHSLSMPKIDVGAGGPGLGGNRRAIDLTAPAAHALGFSGLANVTWSLGGGPRRAGGAFARGGMFSKPTYLVGEENRPEFVISTNPTHAAANRGYLADAASSMGYDLIPAARGFSSAAIAKSKGKGKRKGKPHPNHGKTPMLPAKDRIGGVGTDDISNAIDASQTTYDNFRDKIMNQTKMTGKGKHRKKVHAKPTAKQLKQLHDYGARVDGYKKLLASANAKIQDFTNLESEIGLLGTLMDTANASPDDKARGLDPKSQKVVTKTWAQWKHERLDLERQHTNQLQRALTDAKKKLGKHASGANLAYILTLANALGTSVQDQKDLAASTDDNADAMATGADAFIETLGLSDFLSGLNESYALAQLNNVEDLPGTPVREDLASLSDDTTAAQNLVKFYTSLLGSAQTYRFHGKPSPDLITDVANQLISAKGTLSGLQDQFTSAATETGPTQGDLYNTAAASLLKTYGGNSIGSFVVGPGATLGGLSLAGSPSGGSAALAQLSQATSPASNGTNVNVTNHFSQPPEDPHLWSQGVAWELQAAL